MLLKGFRKLHPPLYYEELFCKRSNKLCGIVGYCNYKCGVDYSTLISMRDSLTYRGPDDAGVYIDEDNGVGLGHRRLSILDLSSLGHQPMSNSDGSIWITYNGEVYNYKEIREQLVIKGHSFKSNTDTEVVLKAYEEWGIECVHKFVGMFALAIWDKKIKRLYLLRDRAGVKPLFYYQNDNILLFGSELKALMAHPDFKRDINHSVMPFYLRYGYIPTSQTIFDNTYKLPPGHYLSFENNTIKETKYWDIVDSYLEGPLHKNQDTITEELEMLMTEAFNYRLISDVPTGIFLSGGIDSSIVTALLQKNTNTQLKTFTIGFNENKFNEAKWAKKIANHLETDHTEYYFSVDECIDLIPEMPSIYDEPFADNSAIPTYLLSKLAGKDVKVVLSADGGDELFCGYDRYKSISSLYSLLPHIPECLRNTIIFTLNKINPNKDKHKKWINIINESGKKNLLNMHKFKINKWLPDDIENVLCRMPEYGPKTYFEDTFSKLQGSSPIDQMMATDFKTFLLDDILAKVDRASMHASIEAREPFLDHRLVEYSARIPLSLKHKNRSSKYILKQILYKHVPRNLVDRPKQGFVIPLSKWLKGSLNPLMMDYLSEDRLKRGGIFQPKVVKQCIKDFHDGILNVHKLWFILSFEMWREKWLPS